MVTGGLVGGWLYRTATRAGIDVLRANQRRGLQEEIDRNHGDHSGGSADGPLNLLLRGERIAQVRSVLARLKVEKTQILLLRHSGLSYREIAETLQINVTSVGTKLARAEAEFAALYQQQQRHSRSKPQLGTAEEGRCSTTV